MRKEDVFIIDGQKIPYEQLSEEQRRRIESDEKEWFIGSKLGEDVIKAAILEQPISEESWEMLQTNTNVAFKIGFNEGMANEIGRLLQRHQDL